MSKEKTWVHILRHKFTLCTDKINRYKFVGVSIYFAIPPLLTDCGDKSYKWQVNNIKMGEVKTGWRPLSETGGKVNGLKIAGYLFKYRVYNA